MSLLQETRFWDWTRTEWGLFGDATGPLTLLAVAIAYLGLRRDRRSADLEDERQRRQVTVVVVPFLGRQLGDPDSLILLVNHSEEIALIDDLVMQGSDLRPGTDYAWFWEDPGASVPNYLAPGSKWQAAGSFHSLDDSHVPDRSSFVSPVKRQWRLHWQDSLRNSWVSSSDGKVLSEDGFERRTFGGLVARRRRRSHPAQVPILGFLFKRRWWNRWKNF